MKRDKKLIQALVRTGKTLDRCGLIIGEGGNISARGRDKRIVYIKKRAAAMGKARPSDYIPLDLKTGKPRREKSLPSTEIYMHMACYKTRSDVRAVIHTHPMLATALSIADVDLTPISYELAVNLDSHIARVGYVRPGTPALGRAVARAIKKHNAVLLKNHGLITVGKDLEQAMLRTMAIERAAITFVSCQVLMKKG